MGVEAAIDDDNKSEFGASFSAAWSQEMGTSNTKSQASAVSVTCDVLAEHRMYAYVTADTYRTRVPWKGKLTKFYWDGSMNVEDIEGTTRDWTRIPVDSRSRDLIKILNSRNSNLGIWLV